MFFAYSLGYVLFTHFLPVRSRRTSSTFTTPYFVELLVVLNGINILSHMSLTKTSFEDRYSTFRKKFFNALSNSTDGNLIVEKANLAEIRKSQLKQILKKVLTCLSSVSSDSSIPHYKIYQINKLQFFPNSFFTLLFISCYLSIVSLCALYACDVMHVICSLFVGLFFA